MKKILLIVMTLFLTSCSKSSEVESCHYSVLFQSFMARSDKEYCQSVYDSFNTAKFNRRISEDRTFGLNSILVIFQRVDQDDEHYILNKDGVLMYDIDNIMYETNIEVERYTELFERIEAQKHPKN